MDEVGRDGVSPTHVAPLICKGVQLEEEVVLAVEEDGTVGIVDPVGRGRKVNLRLPGGGKGGHRRSGRRLLCEGSRGENKRRCQQETVPDNCRCAERKIRGHTPILLGRLRILTFIKAWAAQDEVAWLCGSSGTEVSRSRLLDLHSKHGHNFVRQCDRKRACAGRGNCACSGRSLRGRDRK